MLITRQNIKYTIFGNFESLGATPEIIGKLYSMFKNEGFLPNIIQTVQFNQIYNSMKVVERPQFINNQFQYKITFLQDRIDIDLESKNNNLIDNIIVFFDKIINEFKLKIIRLAVASNYAMNNIDDNISSLKTILKIDDLFNENLIGWESRKILRETWENKANEKINIIQDIHFDINTKVILMTLDINTLSENMTERFNINDCKEFYAYVLNLEQKMLDEWKVILK